MIVKEVAREDEPGKVKATQEVIPVEVPQDQVNEAREVLLQEVETLREDLYEEASLTEMPREVVHEKRVNKALREEGLYARMVMHEKMIPP